MDLRGLETVRKVVRTFSRSSLEVFSWTISQLPRDFETELLKKAQQFEREREIRGTDTSFSLFHVLLHRFVSHRAIAVLSALLEV